VLDSKNPQMREIVARAPNLADHLDDGSRRHFEQLRAYLDTAGVRYRLNPHLVRGLDYYARTVFEWTTTALGAQGTVCAGGRYDGLVEQLGGRPTPAAGFALGLERLVELVARQAVAADEQAPQACIVVLDEAAEATGLALAERLRNEGLRVLGNSGGSLKSQFKRAERSGAAYALLLGANECAAGTVSVKGLGGDSAPQHMAQNEVAAYLRARLPAARRPADI
jgi:histidyl-tRNA synthetase